MTYDTTIHTQADVAEMWGHLMGAGGFGGRSVWLTVLSADGRTTGFLTEIAECEAPLDHEEQQSLAEFLRMICHETVPDGRVALLYSRPGHRPLDEEDRRWAASLYAGCRLAGVAHEVVHLADASGVRAVPIDELPLTG